MSEQEVLVIDLNPRFVECIACEQMTAPKQGLPMREGEFLENDDAGEWAGFTCCRSCYEIHRLGGVMALRLHLAALSRRAHDTGGKTHG